MGRSPFAAGGEVAMRSLWPPMDLASRIVRYAEAERPNSPGGGLIFLWFAVECWSCRTGQVHCLIFRCGRDMGCPGVEPGRRRLWVGQPILYVTKCLADMTKTFPDLLEAFPDITERFPDMLEAFPDLSKASLI